MNSSHEQLSETQQIVLNVLPIPSAIISILGSSAIIYLALQRKKLQQWTPYTRLLVCMSLFDILFSMTIGVATFLRPSDTSFRTWAYGNDATCSFVAFMNQVSTAGGIWYNGMLSFYFLLTARYGMKTSRIAKRIEPLMHLFATGYAIGTAIVGLVIDSYGEKAGAMACWKSRYTNDDDGKVKESDAQHDIVGLLFWAVPMFIVFISLLVNNIIIYCFVRRHTRKLSSQQRDESSTTSSKSEGMIGRSERNTAPLDSSGPSIASDIIAKLQQSKARKQETRITSQSQRLQLVFSQSFLFVVSFMMCQFWNLIMGLLSNNAKDQGEELEILARHYVWAILQATFLPMQGFFNMVIFLRPRYLMLRLKFPSEGRIWVVKRMFQGYRLHPTVPKQGGIDAVDVAVDREHEANNDGDAPIGGNTDLESNTMPNRMPRNMVSSLTVSDGDFHSIVDDLGDDERWHDVSSHVSQTTPSDLASAVSRITTLEAISEMSESVFELTPYQVNGSHLSVVSDRVSIPSEPSERRWKGAERSNVSSAALGSSSAGSDGCDQGDVQRRLGTDSMPEVPRRTANFRPNRSKRRMDTLVASDTPILLPIRTPDVPKDPGLLNTKPLPISPKLWQGGNQASDVPLKLPERFDSLPPSEIEEA